MRLWLDDLREPWRFGYLRSEWAKTANHAVEILKTGTVTFASLDHDLTIADTLGKPTGEKTGYDVVLWLEETGLWPPEGVAVHSMNPVGKERMRRVIEHHYGPEMGRYLRALGDATVRQVRPKALRRDGSL